MDTAQDPANQIGFIPLKGEDPANRFKTNLDSLGHPLRHVERLIQSTIDRYDDKFHIGEMYLTFQSFQFEPGDYEEDHQYRDKETLRMRIYHDSSRWDPLKAFVEKAEAQGDDVTLLSTVEFTANGRWCTMHIPMVDFACTPNAGVLGDATQKNLLCSVLAGMPELKRFDLTKSFSFFESGRSFHGYGDTLLSGPEWVKFMGGLLLMNMVDRPAIVDSRWVGHRLVKGYSALRFTKTNPKYLKVPSHIECPF